ncbi:MAG: DUF3047 domain-containing protein, partial [Calditrichaeota bacterium]
MFQIHFRSKIEQLFLKTTPGSLVVLLLISSAGFAQTDGGTAEGTLVHAFAQWRSVAQNPDLSPQAKQQQWMQLVDNLFYMQRLSQQILYKNWSRLSSYDRERFRQALKTAILRQIESSKLVKSADGNLKLQVVKKEVKQRSAGFEIKLTGDGEPLNAKIYLLKTPQGDWKITNLKIRKKSLIRHYVQFCKKLLDRYSFPYMIAELGDYNEVVLEDFENGTPGQFPPGWSWKKKDNNKRKPYVVREEDHNKYLEATDRGESVIIGKNVKWNLKKYRYVSFRWRVHKIPKGGDERYGKTVDSAAGIYFIYKKKMGLIPESVKYVWSSTLPVGSAMRRSGVGKPWMVVADS